MAWSLRRSASHSIACRTKQVMNQHLDGDGGNGDGSASVSLWNFFFLLQKTDVCMNEGDIYWLVIDKHKVQAVLKMVCFVLYVWMPVYKIRWEMADVSCKPRGRSPRTFRWYRLETIGEGQYYISWQELGPGLFEDGFAGGGMGVCILLSWWVEQLSKLKADDRGNRPVTVATVGGEAREPGLLVNYYCCRIVDRFVFY